MRARAERECFFFTVRQSGVRREFFHATNSMLSRAWQSCIGPSKLQVARGLDRLAMQQRISGVRAHNNATLQTHSVISPKLLTFRQRNSRSYVLSKHSETRWKKKYFSHHSRLNCIKKCFVRRKAEDAWSTSLTHTHTPKCQQREKRDIAQHYPKLISNVVAYTARVQNLIFFASVRLLSDRDLFLSVLCTM